MADGVGTLYEFASEYLAACEQACAFAPGGAITRSFVSPGPPAFDCSQLAVYVGGPIDANTQPLSPPLAIGRRPSQTGAVHLVNLTCLVTRCVPVLGEEGEPPDPAAIEASAQETIGDVWSIWNTVRSLYRKKLIFTRPDGIQRELFFDGALPLHPLGGIGGWQIPIRVQVDGYSL